VNDDLSHYEVGRDLSAIPNSSHAQLVTLVGKAKRVLDLGCWTGELGAALAAEGCRVSGVEINPEAAEKARAVLDEVVVADLDATLPSEHFAAGSFDVVVLADVLEHLRDPARVLADVGSLLAEGGRVVASIPNVTHGSVRLALLQGRWSYTGTGLLDDTHVRFFARDGVADLFARSGLLVDQVEGTTADPLATEVVVVDDRLPSTVIEWVRDQPDSLVYQFLVVAHPQREGEVQDPAALQPKPIVPDADVRRVDGHTERARQDLEDRHRLLTVRDHIIGLEATAATAQFSAEASERKLRGASKRLNRKNERIKELTKEVRRLQAQLGERPDPTGVGWRQKLGRGQGS
jgi:2-polyprenyl-3-methyl-5-hydroxy-6-metoxy-1,4-benzoquinol methylase